VFFPSLLLTLLSAFLLYISFPNPFFLPGYNLCAFVFAITLFFALENKSVGQRLFLGLLFGYVFHGLVVNWFVPYSLPGYLFFISVLTIHSVIFCVFYRRLASSRLTLFFVPALWVAGEYVRGLLMQGESWNIGYTQSFNTYLIQSANIFGSWIISFLLVFINYGIYQSVKEPRRRWHYARVILILLGGFYVYGWISIKPIDPDPAVSVVTFQPDIEYPSRVSMADSTRITNEHIHATGEIPRHWNPDLLIWPETAVPSDFMRDNALFPVIQKMVREKEVYFLTGAAIEEGKELFNGAVFMDRQGKILDIYRKKYLVPFSEYYPSGGLWNMTRLFLRNESQGFSPGVRPGLFQFPHDDSRLAGRRFAVVICSEDNMSSLFRQYRLNGAEFMIVLLNNGWFEDKAGLVMHGQHSVMRAVENRVPVIRSSNNGWTAAIDRYGRFDPEGLHKIQKKSSFHYKIHPNKDIPIYSIIGDTLCWICSAFVIMILLYERKRT